jgi:hypothetical protein
MHARNAHSRAFALLASIAGGSLLLPRPAAAEAWKPESDPFRLSSAYVYSLDALPLSSDLPASLLPWSGPFWSSRQGGIALRWATNLAPWEYVPPTLEQARAMGADGLSALSPAEKLDILRGEWGFPTVARMRADSMDGEAPSWWGICNGWSQASAQLREPVATRLRSRDGIEIPFSSADLKAIASWYFEDSKGGKADHDVSTRRLGAICDSSGAGAGCRRDLNPGALHVVVTNQIARLREAVFADLSRGEQVWQHPILGFRARVLGERSPRPSAAAGTEREVHVRLELRMADYAGPEAGPTGTRTTTRTLRYWLELDRSGAIVGGSWATLRSGAPDYLWVTDPAPIAHGYEAIAPALPSRVFCS